MEVEKAFKRLLVKNPFYGLFCLSLPKIVTTKVPTMCVSKQGISCQLNINPDFWEKHTDEEQLALLQHELGHICFQHMFMHDSFADQKLFNVSADCEVNSYIENLPKSACVPEWLGNKIGKHLDKGLGTKKYYEAIQDYLNQQQQAQAQNPQKPCNGGQGGSGSQSQNSQSNSQNSADSSQNSPQNSNENSQNDSQNSPQSSSSPSEATQDENRQNDDCQKNDKSQHNQDSQINQPIDNFDNSDSSDNENPQEQSQGQQERGENEEQESQYPEELKQEFHQFDDHSTWDSFDNIPEATKQLMQNNINNILKNTAEQVEKMRGTIPGEFTELIGKLRQKKPEVFNWKAYFRRLLGSIYDVNIRSTRRKVSKRFVDAAGIQHKKKVSILVAIDTSGSVSQKELQEFFSEIDYAFKAGARITILQCDTRINDIMEYDGKNIPEIKGRGGTDFNPPVDYYVKHRKEYASLIYFTDGDAPLPNQHPQNIVWVISSYGCHQDYPGKAIYIPKELSENN